MKKRILALFLACMMIVSVIAVPAFAEEECAHESKTYTPMAGGSLPENCQVSAICSWVCNNEECGKTGYEKIFGKHVLTTGIKPATCTSPSLAGEWCSVEGCDFVSDSIEVPGSTATGHDWVTDTEDDDYVAPTCDEKGYGSSVCNTCGEVDAAAEIPALGHDWDVVGVVEANCEHGAGIESACKREDCDATKVDEFPADSDLYDPTVGCVEVAVPDLAPTCGADGYTGRTACKNCGKVMNEGTTLPRDTSTHTPVIVGNPLKAATCTVDGIGKFECKDCKEDLGYLPIKAKHTFVGTVTDAPDCGNTGVKTYTCTVCNDAKVTYTEVIPATGKHKPVEGRIPPTCTSPAKYGQFCEVCDYEISVVESDSTDEDKALGHNYDLKTDCKNGVAPTCTAVGKGYYICKNCGDPKPNGGTKDAPITIPMVPHDYDWTNPVDSPADCENPAGVKVLCKVCSKAHVEPYTGELAADPKGHTSVKIADLPATCGATGYSGRYKCSVCHKITVAGTTLAINPDNHTYVETKVLKPKTCTTAGVGMYTCSNKECADVTYKSIAAGHDWVQDTEKTNIPAECGKAGTQYLYCKTCSTEANRVTSTKPIAALSHDFKTLPTAKYIEPDCLNGSRLARKQCTKCKAYSDYIQASDKLPALNHKFEPVYEDVVVDKDGLAGGKAPKAPTCSATGWGYYGCIRCDATNGGSKDAPIELAKLPHTWGEGENSDATCTTPAGIKRTCDVCDEVEITPYTGELAEAAKGHTVVTLPDLAPTCMLRGYTNRKQCSVCGTVTNWGTILPNPDNHVYEVAKVLKAPTCTELGVGMYKCTNPECEGTEYYDAIEAGHVWNEDEDKFHASANGDVLYTDCDKCDAIKTIWHAENEELVGTVLPGVVIDAEIKVTGKVLYDQYKNAVQLTVQVKGVDAAYKNVWLELNGVKVNNYTVNGNDYTFICKVNVKYIARDFNFVLKSETADILCATEVTSFSFLDSIPDDFEVEYTPVETDVVENATASFVQRGIVIGQTVKMGYVVDAASEDDYLVFQKVGSASFEKIKISDLEGGVYAEFDIAAADWDSVYAIYVVDAEGEVVSNTYYYSVAEYAANKINNNPEDVLSNTLKAMMYAVAV